MRAIALLLTGMLLAGAALAGPCQPRRFEDTAFTVCGFDTHDMRLAIIAGDAKGRVYGSFAAYAAQHSSRKIRFAMNAGMFGTDGWPIGLYVEDGKIRHKANTRDGGGNFHMKPNGVFAQKNDGGLILESTEDFLAKSPPVRWATQSGPLLVQHGRIHPGITDDGPSRYVRNGVGLLDSGRAWFVISDEPVSFGRLARFFRDGLHCREALYFDGAVSSLWVPRDRRQDDHAALGPLVIVSDR
jgi:uncharacterized protein YigE (DUF2233 family)